METIEVLLLILGIIYGIFTICLMFKLWKMCNNVNEIKESIKSQNTSEDDSASEVSLPISVGMTVVRLSDEKQLKVLSIDTKKKKPFLCRVSGMLAGEQYYDENEIMEFSEYWKGKKK